jgi:ketosteroid isomerase-like protein
MNDDLRDFEQFMRQREEAARAYVRGEAAPLAQLSARTGDATFFGPLGGSVQGAQAVFARYESDAKSFAPGSDSHFEILHMGASNGLAYWVGFQKASAHMQGRAEPIPFNLRVTELFRRENGEWKLVHRHADALAEEQKPQR